MQRYLGTPNLAWDFLTLAEPERWDAYFAAADQPRANGADFSVHGRRYGLFAHDFRQVPMSALLERITERALAQDITPSPATSKPPLLVLSQTSSTTPCGRQCVTCADRICWRATRCCGPAWSVTAPGTRSRLGQTLQTLVCAAVETPAGAPARRQAVACCRADLCASGRHPRASRRGTGAAVQHVPPAPHPRRGSCRGLAVGPGDLRQASLSTIEQHPVWEPSNRWAQSLPTRRWLR